MTFPRKRAPWECSFWFWSCLDALASPFAKENFWATEPCIYLLIGPGPTPKLEGETLLLSPCQHDLHMRDSGLGGQTHTEAPRE